MNIRKYDRNPIARKRAGKRQTFRQLLIQRALLKERLENLDRFLDSYERSLPHSHTVSTRAINNFIDPAEIHSFTKLSEKFDELIQFAESYLEINAGKPKS